MTNDEIEKLFIIYLWRNPYECEKQYCIHENVVNFRTEIENCIERKDLVSGPRIINKHNYPDNKLIDENEVKIAIGSNENFYKKTIPVIVLSLLKAGIKRSNIIVFVAGSKKSHQTVEGNIQFRFLDHNSFENSAFIDIVESELTSKFWFFIHDTCKVGNNFKKVMLDVPEHVEKVALRSFPSMSIGLYSHDYILQHKQKILSVKNTSHDPKSLVKRKLWGIPNEDLFLWLTEPEKTYCYNLGVCHIIDNKNWYGERTKRFTEYYPNLDLYKNKSNWYSYFGKNLQL